MAETLPGWAAPVYQGMAEPPQFKGVPFPFFAFNLLGTLFAALCLMQAGQYVYAVVAVLAGGALYLAMLIGGKLEPRWAGIWWEYRAYAHDYEA